MLNYINDTKLIKFKFILIFIILNSCSDIDLVGKTYVECSYDEENQNELIDKNCDWNGNLATTSTGTCFLGNFICVNEKIICSNAIYPENEICDALDNDCNGLIDDLEGSSIELCYSGPGETVINYPCRAGIKTCFDGNWICNGETIPEIIDTCGDNLDNDCNGIIDDSNEINPNRIYDLVLIIDRSASMASYVGQIRAILNTISYLDSDKFKIWLFDLPKDLNSEYGPNTVCHGTIPIYPLIPCNSINIRYLAQTYLPDQGSDELIYDLLYDIITNKITFNWSAARSIKYIIFFGDEEGQTRKNRTETQLSMLFRNSTLSFVGFVKVDFYYDGIGQVYDLENPDLRQLFEQRILNTCQ